MARVRAISRWLPHGARVLDVGCGRASLLARRPDLAYTGIDSLDDVVKANVTRYPGAAFLRVDWERDALPAAEPFDVVLMLALIEHLADPRAALARARAVLTQSGRLLITTPAPLGRQLLRTGARLRLLSRAAAEEHHDLLSSKALQSLAHEAGFASVVRRSFLLGLNQLIIAGCRPGAGRPA